ncbi:MAG: dTDP-4-dehydrorhamnose 3,5-epimerase [Hyphomicrobiaceae bacterium]
MVRIEELEVPGVRLVVPRIHRDPRGFFSETYNRRALAEAGIDLDFVQDNHSLSREVGVVRGLHYQTPPAAQVKLVRVVRGAILDVAVDIRHGSPTFGRHVAVILSEENWHQLLIPVGFAHGFCTLMPDTEVIYKVTEYYAPSCDKGIAWDDPALGIDWPVDPGAAILSDKDRRQPPLGDMPEVFPFAGP